MTPIDALALIAAGRFAPLNASDRDAFAGASEHALICYQGDVALILEAGPDWLALTVIDEEGQETTYPLP